MTVLQPGFLFANRFQIDQLMGTGGMGAIYRARDNYSGSFVALKILISASAMSPEYERFTQEAQVLAELRHPGIVQYVSHGVALDGQRYLAMEWLDGEDLASRLRRGPLSIGQSIALLRSIAIPLSLAHQNSIVHRDLKPSNIFLVEGSLDHVKLLDFGIARRMDASISLTQTGATVGTPQYMSPEQARGFKDLTPSTDVFVLGCVFYECLCGRPPFIGEDAVAVLVRILLDEPESLSVCLPLVPTQVTSLLERLLAKNPAQRPPNATALLAEIDALGVLPTLQLAVTSLPTFAARPLTDAEQSLLCVVIASQPKLPDGVLKDDDAATINSGGAAATVSLRQQLQHELILLGAQVEWLMDGSLVAAIAPNPGVMGSAADQVMQAARCGLYIKRAWPHCEVALGTGRGLLQHQLPAGEAVERAVKLLRSPTFSASKAQPLSGIWLDGLSQALLSTRFAVSEVNGTHLLTEEIVRVGIAVDASRCLMGKPTECVGREAELNNLEGQLQSCIDESEARVVIITASPGAGKSRLRDEFLRRILLRHEDLILLQASAEMMSAGAPYGILSQVVRRLCGLSGSEPLSEQQGRLIERIGRHLAATERTRIIDFVGESCEIPFADNGSGWLRAAREDPRIMQDQCRRAWREWILAECQHAPVMVVLDDLQWGDTLSVELFNELLRELRSTPLLMVALGRPEINAVFPKLWQDHKPQELALKGLSKKACERLVQQVLGKSVAAAVVARIIEQAAGNALYLEELIRAEGEGKTVGQANTVLAMLQARIGRLESGPRRVARAAGVFGQTFWAGGVARLLGHEGLDWRREFQALIDAELIERHSGSRLRGEVEYGFRHALMRDAAYSLLTESDVRAGHLLAGEYLDGAGEQDATVIAAHYERGGDLARAVPLYVRAAEQAFEGHDLEGTLRIAEQAVSAGAADKALADLRILQARAAFWLSSYEQCQRWALPTLPMLKRGSIAFFRLLADVLIASSRLGDNATVDLLYREAVCVDAEPNAYDEQLICLSRMSFHWLTSANLDRADELLARLAALSPSSNSSVASVRAQLSHALGMRACIAGDMAGYAEKLSVVVAAFEETGDLRNAAIETTTLALSLLQLGQVEEAETLSRRNLIRCEQLRVHQASSYARLTLGLILVRRQHKLEEAYQLLATALSDYEAIRHRRRIGLTHGYLALLFCAESKLVQATRAAEQAVENLAGAGGFHAWALALHADVLLRSEKPGAALSLARMALALFLKAGGSPVFELLPYAVLAEALEALTQDLEATEIVLAALERLKRRIEQIPHRHWQQSYLALPEQQRLHGLARRLCPQALAELQLELFGPPVNLKDAQPSEETCDLP